MFAGSLCGFEELRKRSLVEIFSSQPDGLDLGGVVDVGQRDRRAVRRDLRFCRVR